MAKPSMTAAMLPHFQPWHLGSVERRLRLATGSTLFAYVFTHLLNHALLNISVPVADQALLIQKWIWQSVPGTVALYGSLAIHPLLGLEALYRRRHWRWTAAEACQMLFGLSIPPLLANHVAVTRAALLLHGLDKGYNAELYALWVHGSVWGWVQMAVLVLAWSHACIGIAMLGHLRRWWPGWRAPLLAAAVVIPVLAVLGFAAGGREVGRALADPVWRAQHLSAGVTGDAAAEAHLSALRDGFWAIYAGLLVILLMARAVRRLLEMRRGLVTMGYPGAQCVRVPVGVSVLDASRRSGIAHASVCGGKGRCSTCRVRVMWSGAPLPVPATHEQAVLDGIGADASLVRLACQLRPRGDLAVVPLIPPEVAQDFVLGRAPRIPGEERFVAAMFIDMRGSTELAAQHMPFDSVFLVGRFVAAATRAVVASGGRPVQFLGDGLLALFGLYGPPDAACRQALAAVAAARAEFALLAPLFEQHAGIALRYGIGLHCGRAIVGDIGFARHVAFTALGQTVNAAHALQDQARDWGAAAVISAAVFEVAGAETGAAEAREAACRDGGPTIPVRVVWDRHVAFPA